jgi:hypothetical protein
MDESAEKNLIKASSPISSGQQKQSLSLEKSQEERSSLCNDNESSEIKPLQFEEIGNKYDELQRKLEEDAVNLEKEKLKQTISNLMSGLEDPVEGLNKSQIDDSLD